ncbi:putative cytochrome P450 superfamily protein isoform X4 [Iris pallida]|uniref:Cytochrome P450 superfamily protein isoform X4 n=1 Tax=Iris pallida TaxID=29817 RepID=A0AAX6FVM5_IRIPA|nr:putative cytochrome P450 superfamily protein isoform X4 [Iris pallida]
MVAAGSGQRGEEDRPRLHASTALGSTSLVRGYDDSSLQRGGCFVRGVPEAAVWAWSWRGWLRKSRPQCDGLGQKREADYGDQGAVSTEEGSALVGSAGDDHGRGGNDDKFWEGGADSCRLGFLIALLWMCHDRCRTQNMYSCELWTQIVTMGVDTDHGSGHD